MQTVYEAVIEGKIEIKSDEWKDGLYFIQIIDAEGESITEKILIQK
jgi:hypothetical protein